MNGLWPSARYAAFACGIVALLVVLFVSTRPVDTTRHNHVRARLSQIEKLNSELNELVLKSRYGLLSNYDPLVTRIDQLKEVNRALVLGEYAIENQRDPTIAQGLSALTDALKRKESLIERFKFKNALLKNSFAYLPKSIAKAAADQVGTDPLPSALEALLAEALQLHVSASAEAYGKVGDLVAQLEERRTVYSEAVEADLNRVVRHARIILNALPEVDALTAQLISEQSANMGDALARAYARSFDVTLERANIQRWCTVLIALALLGYAGRSLFRFHQASNALHESASHNAHLEQCVADRTHELIEANRGLTEAKEQAEAGNRAKSQFLANMSHEIRTPLNAIVGMAHLMQRGGVTPRQSDQLGKLQVAANHLLRIIGDVLDLSKIEAGKLILEDSDIVLTELFAGIETILAPRVQEKGLQLAFDIGDIAGSLRGDSTRLAQALLNYANNAVKFTQRGVITLRARRVGDSGEEVVVRFEVTDTGTGIDADALDRMFHPFEQADASTTRRYGGTGLGLAITRRLAQLMGGDVGVESVPGVGSTFWFTARLRRGSGIGLPVQRGAPADAEAQLRTHMLGTRVLLAEDDAVNREIAVSLLEEAGLCVDTARDGVEAIVRARDCDYALILMDIQMPNMDGIEATRAIRALPGWQTKPIVAMTANAFSEDRRACGDAGMNDFVPKPVDPQTLFAAIWKWIGVDGLPADRMVDADPGRTAAAAMAVHFQQSQAALAWQSPTVRPLAPDPDAVLARVGSLSGVDCKAGLARLRGNRSRYIDLFFRFITAHAEDMTVLKALLAKGDTVAAQRLAHTLRGTGATLGAFQLAATAGHLETMILSRSDVVDPGTDIDALAREIGAELERLAIALRPEALPWTPGSDLLVSSVRTEASASP